jgi:branched-chain amino acid transport system substrate-binding protein
MTQRRVRYRALALATLAAFTALACGTTQGNTGGTTAKSDVGITDTEIHIGTTQPLSGAASAYASINKGSTAYFSWLNDQGGIFGRKVKYDVLDDGYDPAKSVPLTKQLVDQSQVFLVFNQLGTPVNTATRPYLNDQKVPQLFVATGASTWGADYKTYPWTIGWQPDYISESKIYAKDILKNKPSAKIGVLYQNDAYGKDYLNGLKQGLGSQASLVVAEQTYNATDAPDMSSQIAALKDKGVDTLFIVCTPAFAISAMARVAILNWKPTIYLNSVANQLTTMRTVVSRGAGAATEGVTSVVYLKDPTDSKWNSDAGMQKFKSIMSKYCTGCDIADGNFIYGAAVAYTFQKVMEKVGKSPVTRDKVMKEARNMNIPDNPFLLPGVAIKTSGDNQWPMTQEALEKFVNGAWVVDSANIINAR